MLILCNLSFQNQNMFFQYHLAQGISGHYSCIRECDHEGRSSTSVDAMAASFSVTILECLLNNEQYGYTVGMLGVSNHRV